MAQAQGFLMHFKDDPQGAVKNVGTFAAELVQMATFVKHNKPLAEAEPHTLPHGQQLNMLHKK